MSFEKLGDLAWIQDLYQIGQSVAYSDDPRGQQINILRHITSGFDAASGSIALMTSGDDDEFEIVAGIDLPDGVVGSRLRRGSGVLGRVAAEGSPLLLNGDVSQDQRFAGHAQTERKRKPHSAMCWPLRIKNRVVGVLAVNRAEGAPPYTEEDLERGALMVQMLAVVVENTRMQVEQQKRIADLSEKNAEILKINSMLSEAQSQLLQSEKLASIGQLAAGVAHEINNPIGYVFSNLGSLEGYLADLFRVIGAYRAADAALGEPCAPLAPARELLGEIDIGFLGEDITALLAECREGITRVKKIVQDLKDFSRVGSKDEWQWANLESGIDSTLNIVRNEIKYKAEVVREYAGLPDIECLPSQLNQVFMNLLVNAAHAIESKGTITIRTRALAGEMQVEVSDTGAGIAPEHLNRIFEPFFTTKPVGKGTGLGLSVSYSIVQKHGGRIEVDSTPGVGTTFRVVLPVQRMALAA